MTRNFRMWKALKNFLRSALPSIYYVNEAKEATRDPWNVNSVEILDVVLIRGSPVETVNDPTTETRPSSAGLLGVIIIAHNLHQNLELRPDDIWVAILAQFSSYVNGRGEELRDLFVAHEGKKLLPVGTSGDIYNMPLD
jgi:hypothetical protein